MTRLDFEAAGIDLPHSATIGSAKNEKVFCPKCRDQRHNRRDKSLSVNLATGEFNCHYCGWKGIVRDSSQGSVLDRVKVQPRPEPKPKQYVTPPPVKRSKLSDRLLSWFKGTRGISEETLLKLPIGEGMEWMPQYGREANTVQFHYMLHGERVNTKYRTGDKQFKMVSGARLIPWNIDAIEGKTECIVTEGEMDAISFVEAGFDNVISVPNGANANLEYLDDFIESHFDKMETIYIAVDTDRKGKELCAELQRRFEPERCRVVTYGDDCKDANELLVKSGGQALKKALEKPPSTRPTECSTSTSTGRASTSSLCAGGRRERPWAPDISTSSSRSRQSASAW